VKYDGQTSENSQHGHQNLEQHQHFRAHAYSVHSYTNQPTEATFQWILMHNGSNYAEYNFWLMQNDIRK